MGNVIIEKDTTINPITQIGYYAGVCWGADTSNNEQNYKRGWKCLKDNHGRTFEFPQVYMTLDGYSARVIREFYTHIGGAPTRLQASTRYIDYENLEYITPYFSNDIEKQDVYEDAMNQIKISYRELERLGMPREDIANILPLGMKTKVVVRTNLRNLIDMSHQRLCMRAYWEYRGLMRNIMEALCEVSPEWRMVINEYFIPKCEVNNMCRCTEEKGCGKYGKE